MATSVLSPIPAQTEITDSQGRITEFFRLRWEELRNTFRLAPTVATVTVPAGSLTGAATIPTTAVFTTLQAGTYRLTYYIRKTAADGVASSLTVTLGWSDTLGLSQAFAALVVDSTSAFQTGTITVDADAVTDLTYAVLYASTGGNMRFKIKVFVEQLS